MPYFTKSSLELLVYPPVHKDIPTELYTTGVPLIAERIFSLLTCVAACMSVQHGITRSPLLPDSWTKSLPTAGSARKMPKTLMHLKNRRSHCVSDSETTTCYLHPQHFDTNPEQKDVFNCHFIQVCQACMA